MTKTVSPWNRKHCSVQHSEDWLTYLVFHLIVSWYLFFFFFLLFSAVGLIAHTGQRREGMELQWSWQVATFPRDIFKYGRRERELKASQEAPFETFQLSMKSLRASTLISKRSSGSRAAGHLSALPFGGLRTALHLTAAGFCPLNWSSNK